MNSTRRDRGYYGFMKIIMIMASFAFAPVIDCVQQMAPVSMLRQHYAVATQQAESRGAGRLTAEKAMPATTAALKGTCKRPMSSD